MMYTEYAELNIYYRLTSPIYTRHMIQTQPILIFRVLPILFIVYYIKYL